MCYDMSNPVLCKLNAVIRELGCNACLVASSIDRYVVVVYNSEGARIFLQLEVWA